MENLKSLSENELILKIKALVLEERKLTLEVLSVQEGT